MRIVVKSGKRYWSDSTLVLGQNFEYGFDDIGNRTQTKAGGNPYANPYNNIARPRVANYTNNNLNQIVGGHVPSSGEGYVDVMGVALATNSVTVNGSAAERKGEYYRKQLFVAGSENGPAWNAVTVADGTTNVTGYQLVPWISETLTYDADGNQNGDSIWTNYWDAENRLVKTEVYANLTDAAKLREEWSYLPDGRWVERIVSTNDGTNYYPSYMNRYVWDGNVLLAVLNGNNEIEMSFLRGLDLSGAMQGAGGVGGLLAVSFKTNGVHFAAYDGNGNVATLVSAAYATNTANYEYGPFAEPLRVTGPMGKANPIRFSTQYADDVRELVMYKYRHYNPSTGRWLSRDPIGDKGSFKLAIPGLSMRRIKELRAEALMPVYVFVKNDPISKIDADGRWAIPPWVWPVAAGIGVGYCSDRLACPRWRDLVLRFAEADADANAPDGRPHRDPPNTPPDRRRAREGDDSDLLTHCIAACRLVQHPGPCFSPDGALQSLQAREVGNDVGTQIDRLNNDVGSGVGINIGPNGDCLQGCLDALNGLLYTIVDGQPTPHPRGQQ